MENEHTLAGLVRKRAEIAGELDDLQARVRQLIAAVDHVDATIRLFAPDMDLEEVAPRPVPVRHAAVSGQVVRAVLDALHNTAQPMTTRDMALYLMRVRGLNVEDVRPARLMTRRVGSTLRKLRDRAVIDGTKEAGGIMSWWLARAGAAPHNSPTRCM